MWVKHMKLNAIDTLTVEAEALRLKTFERVTGELPDILQQLFGDASEFFSEEMITQWRLAGRFDELIDYIHYQYGDKNGDFLWKQILLDLRLIKDDLRAIRLLEGLVSGRMETLNAAKKNFKKFPNNYLAAATVCIAKAEVLKILYEVAFILENRPIHTIDKKKTEQVKNQILKVMYDD
jgi:hypothetical protein